MKWGFNISSSVLIDAPLSTRGGQDHGAFSPREDSICVWCCFSRYCKFYEIIYFIWHQTFVSENHHPLNCTGIYVWLEDDWDRRLRKLEEGDRYMITENFFHQTLPNWTEFIRKEPTHVVEKIELKMFLSLKSRINSPAKNSK